MMIASCCRRALLGVSFCVLAALSALPADADQITFVSQGGAYQKAQTIAILDPSAKKLGITINQDSIPDAWPAIKSQVASGKPTWDVVDVPTGYCLRGGEQGLLEKLDFSKLPNGAAMPEAYRSPYSVAYEFYSSVLAYSQKKFSAEAAPNSWADFWDVKKFPGRRCLPAWPRFVFEAALMADGVEKSKLYPLDMERALKKVKEIKPSIAKWWTTSAQPPQLMLDGEADMCMAYTGSMSKLALEGAPVELEWNEGFIYYDFFSIPKGAPHYENALKLLSWRLDPQRAAQLTSTFPVALPSPVVFEAADRKISRYWANNPANVSKAIEWSPDYWGAASPSGKSTNEEYGQEKLNALLAQ